MAVSAYPPLRSFHPGLAPQRRWLRSSSEDVYFRGYTMKNKTIDEQSRLASLCELGILDTPPEQRFDQFTLLATATFGAPIALVSLVDAERQWFKSRQGLAASQTSRSIAFCSHAIEGDDTFIVNDTLLDERFASNPLVLDAPRIRFYAGHPIKTLDGFAVGTLCIIDTAPRMLTADQVAMLQCLAQLVEDELNKERMIAGRSRAEAALCRLNAELEERVAERTAALQQKNDALSREIKQRCDIEMTLRRSEERVRTMIDTSFSAFVATDCNGSIIEWNPSAERVFGWRRDDILGRSLAATIIPQRHRAAHEADMARFVASGRGSELDQILQLAALTVNGDEIAIEMTINTFSLDGQTYCGAFLNDVSERAGARQQLEQKQELLDAVLESVDVAVIACDAAGGLSLFNRAAREFHGLQPTALPSGDWAAHYDLYEADGKTPLAPHAIPLLRALAGEAVKDARIVIAPRGMKRRTLLASGRRLEGPGGERLGAVVAMKDITELSESQEKLRASEHALRAITENLPTLIGQVDRSGRFVFLNSRSVSFYGQPAQKLLGQPVRSVYSDAEFAKIKTHIDAAAGGRRAAFESEIKLDGKVLHYHASFVPNFCDNGTPDGYFAMAFDITARRQSEIRRMQSEERLQTISDNVPVLISYLDNELRFQFANAMYKDWLGVRSEDMIGKSVSEVFGASGFDEQADSLSRALGGHMSNAELTVNRKGRTRILSTTYMPHIRDGKTIGIYVLATDATAARAHERHLLELANEDPLTSLPNRRMYEFQLAKSLAAARRNATRLALMYLDLDDFKKINDSLGHSGGDEVLIEFSSRVSSVLRESDMLARLAGDEFTVILEAVGSAAACELVAEKILDVLRQPFIVAGRQIHVSTSIGVAFGCDGASAEALGEHADQALYTAKRAGKNQFAVVSMHRGHVQMIESDV